MRTRTCLLLTAICTLSSPMRAADRPPAGDPIAPALHFEPNLGQTGPSVRFLARAPGYTLFLRDHEAVISLAEQEVIRMSWSAAGDERTVRGLDRTAGRSHYLRGADREGWQTDVPHYGRVSVDQIHPGIDLVFYGNPGLLEYDFVVAPGADPDRIELGFDGATAIERDPSGDLLLSTACGVIRIQKPVCYQLTADGEREAVEGDHFVRQGNRVQFELGGYDPSRTLVIDPILAYSTFVGGFPGFEDNGAGLVVDDAGNVFVAGHTSAANYPLANATQGSLAGDQDVVISKLDPSGSTLLFSTFFGGSKVERCEGIALDENGRVYVVGETLSADLPVQNAFQGVFGGIVDGFVARLDAGGSSLEFSSYLGGFGVDRAHGISVQSPTAVFVTGNTEATDFPITAGAFQTALDTGRDAFVAKIDSDAGSLVYSTYLGGGVAFGPSWDSGWDVAHDAAGRAVVFGQTESGDFPVTGTALQSTLAGASGDEDFFVTVLDPTGSALEYSTFLGGSAHEGSQSEDSDVDVDAAGRVFIGAATRSSDYPTTAGSHSPAAPGAGPEHGVICCIDPSVAGAAGLVFSTYLGGNLSSSVNEILLDADGSMWAAGHTVATDFPTEAPIQADHAFQADGFVTRLSGDASSILFSTYLGGSGIDLAYGLGQDADGDIYVSGTTQSGGFPTTAGAFDTDGSDTDGDFFIARIDLDCSPPANYGNGSPGSGGLVPTLTTASTAPRIGSTVPLDCDQIVGGATCFLVVGFAQAQIPVKGIDLLVSPVGWILVPLAASGTSGVAGDGEVHLPVPIPNDINAIGVELDFQLLVLDGGVANGVAASDGLSFVICDGF